MSRFSNILLATDLSECSARAARTAMHLARDWQAKLAVVHVYGFPKADDGLTAGRALHDWLAALHIGPVDPVVRAGAPAEQIITEARERGADLMVIGTHGQPAVGHFLMGSTAVKLVRLSPVPVLTVRSTGRSNDVLDRSSRTMFDRRVNP
jgi:nucleotide-binding universal stress UspA family protein